VARSAELVRFHIALSDVDRGIYDTLDIRTAQHPSESDDYLVTRVLAYALEYREGLSFSRGLCVPDEPALWVQDPTGAHVLWIEIGNPKMERLHKASKACPQVKIYTYKDAQLLHQNATTKSVHRAETIEVCQVPTALLQPLAQALTRTNTWTLVRSEGELFVTVGEQTATGALHTAPLVDG
jgi:uncharacterized protein YaeQ